MLIGCRWELELFLDKFIFLCNNLKLIKGGKNFMIKEVFRHNYQLREINGKTYIRVSRYSNKGFIPQFQLHHFNQYIFNKFKTRLEDYPETLRETLKEVIDEKIYFYEFSARDLFCGVWIFIAGNEDNYFLNHLKFIPSIHYGWLPENTNVYSFLERKKYILSDLRLLIGGGFVPERELKNLIIE